MQTEISSNINREIIEITLPSDQREGNQAAVHRWLKKVGDAVTKNEPILEINTDKVTLEVVAPVSGVLVEICKNAKESVALSDIFGRIAQGASAAKQNALNTSETVVIANDQGSSASGSISGGGNSNVTNGHFSPAVKNLAAVHGINPNNIRGTGENSRVTARDIEKAARAITNETKTSATINLVPHSLVPHSLVPHSLVPHSPMRRAIAAEMARSMAIAPHVTSVFECDFDAVLAHRKAHKDEFAERGVKLTVTAYLVRASALALKAVPQINASWMPEHLALHSQINIGVATAIESQRGKGGADAASEAAVEAGGEAGLIVPVIKKSDTLSLFECAQELQRLTELARNSKLSTADITQGTFTISNHGVSGSLVASPIIILQPQVAILGVGKLQRRVVVSESAGKEVMEIRSRAYVTLTIDHRALDGFTANRFLTLFSSYLQMP